MSNLHLSDNEFFEEYKRLDRLCGDMYSCKNGVSEYISQMESKAYQGRYRVSSWDSDYKMLKHVRWVRNQIAHDSGTYQFSDSDDLAFVQDFYHRIFSGQDSLTLLRKSIDAAAERQKQHKKQQASKSNIQSASYSYAPPKKKSHKWIGILVALGILALILLIVFLAL